MIAFGILGFVWYDQDEGDSIVSRGFTLYCSIYSLLVGALILAWEQFFGIKRGPSPIPTRGAIYLLLSVFLFMSWPTLLPAFFVFGTAVTNFAATAMGEVYEAPPIVTAVQKKLTDQEAEAEGFLGAIRVYFASIRQQNKVGQAVFFFAYFCGNVVLFSMTLNTWIDKIDTLKSALNDNKEYVPTGWAPFAKAFGALLDLNCALILLPVVRTLLRYLYNRSTADQGFVSTVLRSILYFIPLDQNLKFHKLIAGVIMGATVGHTVMHYINFAARPAAVLFLFEGAWPMISGGIVCICMFIIYTAASGPKKYVTEMRRGQFEIFWYSHHVFIFFFIFLFTHGKGGLNPGFWRYIIAPGALYLIERLLRIYRANQKVVILSATIMDDVYALEFAKEGFWAAPYQVGQYIFLNSPHCAMMEWHPFTISSAPEEKTVTLHIRVSNEGSWTKELVSYIAAMGPRGKPWFPLDRQGPNGKLAGKICGPDGKALLCADGPHSVRQEKTNKHEICDSTRCMCVCCCCLLS